MSCVRVTRVSSHCGCFPCARRGPPSLAVMCAPRGQLSLPCGKGGAQQDLCPRGLCCEPETTCSVLTGMRGQSPRQDASNHTASHEHATRAPRSEAPPQAHMGPHGCTWLLTLPELTEAPASASPGTQAHGPTCRSRTSSLTRTRAVKGRWTGLSCRQCTRQATYEPLTRLSPCPDLSARDPHCWPPWSRGGRGDRLPVLTPGVT